MRIDASSTGGPRDGPSTLPAIALTGQWPAWDVYALMSSETTAAFHELIDLIRDADRVFLDGPRAVGEEVSVVEGYRWLTEILAVALECYLWADAERPAIVPIVGPTRKFGGDN